MHLCSRPGCIGTPGHEIQLVRFALAMRDRASSRHADGKASKFSKIPKVALCGELESTHHAGLPSSSRKVQGGSGGGRCGVRMVRPHKAGHARCKNITTVTTAALGEGEFPVHDGDVTGRTTTASRRVT